MKKIVILGAGYAGVDAALTLQKRLRNESTAITLIDKNEYHTLLTELHELAGGRVEEGSVKIFIKDILQYTKVNIIKDEITSIDFNEQILCSQNSKYQYDFLIIGCGSEPAFFGIEGMDKHAFSLWSLEDAKTIRSHIVHIFESAWSEEDIERRKELLTFVVGGGGFTGIEMVGELIHWVKVLCREYGISEKEVRLVVIEAMDKILAVLHDSLVDKAMRYLSRHGVEVLTNSPITKVTEESLELKGGTVIHTRTVIWTGGVKANGFVEKLDLPKAERGRGRIEVNEYMQSSKHDHVFLVGDNSFFTQEDGKPLPLLVESAIQTGAAAAENIVHILHNEPLARCRPKLHGTMVSIGRKYAVADTMGYRTSGWLAMFIKHMVNIHYQFEVAGFEQVIRYLKHQFIHKRKDDHFIKDHLVTVSYTLFLVPMRMYLGYMWLMQGLKKYHTGWLSKALLYTERIGPAMPDAGSTATPAADTAAEAVREGLNLIGKYTPEWYAWIAENIIVPNALVFQKLIVLTEIGLGVAFLSGTFTFLAALVSIGMNINFLLSTGLYDYWYIVTSIACLGGAGRAFGVDHYLIPWLMRQWRYFVRNKRIKMNV